ncbi:glmZ(sRNA)-inactivating NTPase [Serratia fonticola]|uniref:GlmZ(SRNA)-inactivating NTPase n=1 Tax=Serratia fonticola TaxID=47917 RepID=A0A4U9W925_SERFO|nr:glmZ(sRNA)-inactivating NTPase [Serratia fonticola]
MVLLPQLAQTLAERNSSAAVSIDVRNMPESPEVFEYAMTQLPESFTPQLLFLDADRNTLIRRYSDTRRCILSLPRTCRWKARSMKKAICLSHCVPVPI